MLTGRWIGGRLSAAPGAIATPRPGTVGMATKPSSMGGTPVTTSEPRSARLVSIFSASKPVVYSWIAKFGIAAARWRQAARPKGERGLCGATMT